jgi:hypothetical protein
MGLENSLAKKAGVGSDSAFFFIFVCCRRTSHAACSFRSLLVSCGHFKIVYLRSRKIEVHPLYYKSSCVFAVLQFKKKTLQRKALTTRGEKHASKI